MSSRDFIFISYAPKDRDFAIKLATDLRANGVNIWFDQFDVEPGENRDRTARSALRECRRFLVVLSPASVESGAVRDELAYAIRQNKPVIAVLCKVCQIPHRLAGRQYIDFTESYSLGLRSVLKYLRGMGISLSEPTAPSPIAYQQAPETPSGQGGKVSVASDIRPGRRKLWAVGLVALLIVCTIFIINRANFFGLSEEQPVDNRMPSKAVSSSLYLKYRAQGDSLVNAGEFGQAKTWYLAALQERPDDDYALDQLVAADSLITARELAMERDSLYQIYMNEGEALFDQDEPGKAREKFAEALKLKPDDPDAQAKIDACDALIAGRRYSRYRRAGEALLQQQNFWAARERFQLALRNKPGDPYVSEQIAICDTVLTGILALQAVRALR